MTDLDHLESQIQNANMQQLLDIVKLAIRFDVSAETREQAGRIYDDAEQRIRELSGFGGDY